MKKIDSQMQNWLNERREIFLNKGQELFESFKSEFNLSTYDARELIHSWDEDFRGIKSGEAKVN